MNVDNPDLEAISGSETVTVRKAVLRELFDTAVGSLDFGSDFWVESQTIAAREIAENLGICPMVATPNSHRMKYPICDHLREAVEAAKVTNYPARKDVYDHNVEVWQRMGHRVPTLDEWMISSVQHP